MKPTKLFQNITLSHVNAFRSMMPKGCVISTLGDNEISNDDLQPFNVDWMKKYKGQSKVVLKPQTTSQVSQILKYCNQNLIPVVPQGGNTGLVGGGVPLFDEVIISTQSLNKVLSFDPLAGVLVCQAGCVLESLDNHVKEHGCIMPLDLGAKGSCHIGGNISTNAGGLRLLRYGSLHGSVLGLEVVLPDGTILNNLSKLRKDNTGYDLKQLFIGSEGTLGIVTAVSILTPNKPNAINVAMLKVNSFEKVQKVFNETRSNLSEILSAFEFWDTHANKMVFSQLSHLRDPFDSSESNTVSEGSGGPFTILIETSGSRKEHDDEKLETLLETLMENETVFDEGVIAQDDTQVASMWAIREGIPVACTHAGACYKYDISMPIDKLYKLVEDVTIRLQNTGLYDPSANSSSTKAAVTSVLGYGHVGDGNLHLNICSTKYDSIISDALEPYVYEWTRGVSGSISAEHGLGLMKGSHIGYSKSPEMVHWMQKIKTLVDPNGIMNPYKFLPINK